MLGKLLKHEFRLTARTLLPFYAALAGLTIIMRLFGDLHGDPSILSDSTLGNLVLYAIYAAYACMFSAVSIITVVLLIERFYKNLLRDEGYLMHTLPVSSGQLVLSKLICATIWSVISILAAILSVMIITFDFSDWAELFRGIGNAIAILNKEIGPQWLLYALELLAICLLALSSVILQVYAATTLGHTANSRKVLWSVAAYIGISTVLVFITAMLGSWRWLQNILNSLLWGHLANEMLTTHIMLLLVIVFHLVKCSLFFGLTNWLMKHRLNLE